MKSAERTILPDTDFYHATSLPGYSEVLKWKIPSTHSITEGQKLFRSNCTGCHGPEGKGDGPGYLHSIPRPTDLTQSATYRYGPGERGIFRSIKYGVPDSGMAPWKGRMTDREIWETTGFVRSLQVNQ